MSEVLILFATFLVGCGTGCLSRVCHLDERDGATDLELPLRPIHISLSPFPHAFPLSLTLKYEIRDTYNKHVLRGPAQPRTAPSNTAWNLERAPTKRERHPPLYRSYTINSASDAGGPKMIMMVEAA